MMAMLNKFSCSTRWAFNFKNWQPTEYEWSYAIMQVQDEERLRIGKFRFRDDAKASLIGRLMMRLWSKQFLSAVSCPITQPIFERTEKGRPKLVLSATQRESTRGVNFDFNVAHAGELTVFAAEMNRTACVSIGVDVMPLTTSRREQNVEEFLRLMRRQFTNDEWAQIRQTSTDYDEGLRQTMKNFYRFWCLKESFVKAEGSGLAWDLQRLSFSCSSTDLGSCPISNTALKIDGTPLRGWQFQECLLSPNHCAAVAVNYNDHIPDTKNLEPFQFVNLHDLLDLNTSEGMVNTCTNTEDHKKEWEIFVSKEIDKPF